MDGRLVRRTARLGRVVAMVCLLVAGGCATSGDVDGGAGRDAAVASDAARDAGVPGLRDAPVGSDVSTPADGRPAQDAQPPTGDVTRDDGHGATDATLGDDIAVTVPDVGAGDEDAASGSDIGAADAGRGEDAPRADAGGSFPDVLAGGGCAALAEGAPCDDGLACTTDDACQEGECRGVADHAHCDDRNPCTRDVCSLAAGCVNTPETGRPCAGAAVCDEGFCLEGECALFVDACDDLRICTEGTCDAADGCVQDVVTRIGRTAPTFTLRDANPESAMFGERLAVPGEGRPVVVVLFHDTLCQSCREQGEAARPMYADLAHRTDLIWITLNNPDSEDSIEEYVYFESDDTGIPASTWPVLMDERPLRTWDRFCADNNDVALVDRDGAVAYFRTVNFLDPPFAAEFRRAVDEALAAE